MTVFRCDIERSLAVPTESVEQVVGVSNVSDVLLGVSIELLLNQLDAIVAPQMHIARRSGSLAGHFKPLLSCSSFELTSDLSAAASDFRKGLQ